MREIKFRVWNNNKMIRSAHLSEDFCFMVTKQGEFVDCVLMQYTGLKDKNGKEIYEGDIVKLRIPFETTTYHISEVFFDCRGALVEAHPMHKELGLAEYRLLLDYCTDRLSPDAYCEVIGNVYENGELLKEAKQCEK